MNIEDVQECKRRFCFKYKDAEEEIKKNGPNKTMALAMYQAFKDGFAEGLNYGDSDR